MNRSDSERLRRIEALLERLDSAVVVKDPGSARSADAFEGLRRTIIQNAKSHRVHVAHLIALDESIWSGATIELIRFRVAEYLRELGVERLEDSSVPEAFDIVGDGQGEFEVLEPAIIERGEDGNFSILKVGKARRTASVVSFTTEPHDLSAGVVSEEITSTTEPQGDSPRQVPMTTEPHDLSAGVVSEEITSTTEPQGDSPRQVSILHRRGYVSIVISCVIAILLLVQTLRACSSAEIESPPTATTVVERANSESNK